MVDRLACMSSRSLRPIISSIVRKPSWAISSRTSWAMNLKKLTTCSACPRNFSRSLGFWVAMPTGQVSRWQTRIMMQPMTTSGRRGEAVLLGAQQRGDHDVAAGLQLAVGLDDDPVAQLVQDQGLLGLGQAQLPGDAGVLERGQRAGAGAAVVAADQDDVAVGLGHARRHRAHAHLGHQLDADPRPRVAVLEVVDQLGQVFDRVDVVVRRRADQADARRRVADLGDPGPDLVAREAGPPRRAWPPGPS